VLEALDKYKFGIIAALVSYVGIFMYLTMDTYTEYFKIEPFHDGAYVEEVEEIEMQLDNIQVPQDFSGDVRNMVNDVNDTRDRSYENYSENRRNASDVEQSVYDLEKQLYDEAGGDSEREKIRQQMENRKNQNTTSTTTDPNNSNATNTGDVAYKGKTMVDFYLKDRDPFQNNRWYIRNPGYTCQGSGTVRVNIKVNQNGNVTSATVAKSSGASGCMIDKALKYAKMSRFAYSEKAPNSQSGWIEYIFVAQ
jgi:TonB family protein